MENKETIAKRMKNKHRRPRLNKETKDPRKSVSRATRDYASKLTNKWRR